VSAADGLDDLLAGVSEMTSDSAAVVHWADQHGPALDALIGSLWPGGDPTVSELRAFLHGVGSGFALSGATEPPEAFVALTGLLAVRVNDMERWADE